MMVLSPRALARLEENAQSGLLVGSDVSRGDFRWDEHEGFVLLMKKKRRKIGNE